MGKGFSREEVYLMPLTELSDYIQILNEEAENEREQMAKERNNSAPREKQLNYGGNTLPGRNMI